MKYTVLFVAALSLVAVGCKPKAGTGASVSTGTTQIQAPVAPPTQTAKAAPQNTAPTKQGTTQIAQTAPQPAAPKKLTPQQRADVNAMLQRLADAFFDYNEASIRPDASTTLTDNVGVIRDILKDYPSEKLLIEGHADERGSSEYNLALAGRRSSAAQEFLSSRGIPQSQLSVISLGEERPACTAQTEECYQKNRRVHITVAP
jgi:peptidoglycan-associated lipoprotein